MNGVWIHMAATSLTTQRLAFDLGINVLIFQCSFTFTNLPGPSSIMRSEQVQQRRFERKHDKERMQRRRKRT